ncbi:MAG: lipoprotein-releasing system transmembrane subunit LolC [Blastocatellia bacterium]|nr:MAG: lipoprotein-releasing system transmembrane subunit LolC [Blastocatellia bacterium]
MDLPFELHVAFRYLLAKRKQAFISVISIFSTVGVTVGVMAVIVALAVMTGLQQELRNRILGSSPHIYVYKLGGIKDYHAEVDKLRQVPHVIGAAPAILGQGLVSVAGETLPVQIKGIDPALEPQVTDIKQALETGTLEGLRHPRDGMADGILLGKDLAAKLRVRVGDEISVLTPAGTLSPMGMIPRPRRLRVSGTLSFGLLELDSTYAYVSLDVAKRLFDKDQVDHIQLRVDNIYDAPAIAASIEEQFGKEYVKQDWAEMNRSLFSALVLEKIAVSMAIFLIVMVAMLNIVSSLILLVMEKQRDIAILKTMGASKRSVTFIFMLQGLVIGVIGTFVGGTAGYVLCRVFDRYRLIRVPTDVYQVSHLPFTVLPLDFALVVATAVFVCFLATIYPSQQAARLDPAQALRYE